MIHTPHLQQPAPLVPPAPPPADFVAWTAQGDLALVDGASGATRQQVPAGAMGERDLAWDPWAQRVLVYQGGEDDGGEIAALPIQPASDGVLLGARAHLVWVDGRARLLAAPAGVVVFEEGYGERWKLLGSAPSPSVSAPRPASAWLTVDAHGATVHGLGYGEGVLERRAAAVDATGIATPSVEPLSVGPATLPPTARLVAAPALGDAVLIDIAGSALAVHRVIGAAASEASLVPLAAAGMRIEAAVPLRGGRVIALLLAGATAELAAVALDPAGAPWSTARLPLPGATAPETRFFSRDLAPQGDDRVLVATTAGVHAVAVTLDEATGVHLALAPGFTGAGLRGPMAVLDPSP